MVHNQQKSTSMDNLTQLDCNKESISIATLRFGDVAQVPQDIVDKFGLDIAFETDDIERTNTILARLSKTDRYLPVVGKIGYVDIVRRLIEQGYRLRESQLHESIRFDDIDMVKLFTEHYRPRDPAWIKQDISYAIKMDRVEMIPLLYVLNTRQEISFDFHDCSTEMMKVLIAKGRKPRIADLKSAIQSNNVEMVKLLIKYGCNLHADLMCDASEVGNLDIVNTLLDAGCPIWFFESVFRDDRLHILKRLIDASDGNLLDYWIDPVDLNEAIKKGQSQVAIALIDAGIDIEQETIELALRYGSLELINKITN